ncbi:hypothetical protein M378DRAFT_166214 [Amanita muscaria Koide BX008]|uniref:Uncharacterized protein n=1 Tax=Amanita muscaria (strain Koide BX008) TaxID=946122 RepID=A0A0C2WYY6_AMAMK|nr:hypothetical protein M378DRAFT_166214 [Amanita muscaria Koide BX008]
MRFVIIYIMSLLLVPSLVASKRWSPSSGSPLPQPPPPLSLPSTSAPEHGDFVRYQASHRSHVGIVVGSQDTHGHINIAPLASNSAHPPLHPIVPLDNHVVSAHPGQVANTGHSSPNLATEVGRQHEDNPPSTSRVSGSVDGSPIHQAMQALRQNRYRRYR